MSEKLLRSLFLITVVCGFLPYSWSTPLGFLSAVDLAVCVLFSVTTARTLARGRIAARRTPIHGLSVIAYALIAASQVTNGVLTSANILIKYFVFLVIIPVSINFSGLGLQSKKLASQLPKALTVAGVLLAAGIALQLVRGNVQGGGGAYYVSIFGQYANKNGLAATLLFGVLASAWVATVSKKRAYWLACVWQILVTFYIGARASTLVDIALVQILYFSSKRISAARIFCYVAAVLGLVLTAVVATQSGLAGQQFARLTQVTDTDTSTITASTSRILLWEFAASRIASSPWLGSGYGTFSYEGDGWLDGMYEPHDSILQIAYAGGFVGLAAFVALLYFGFRGSGNAPGQRQVCLLLSGYLLTTLVDIIWVRGDGHIFWLLFFLMALSRDGTRKTPVQRFVQNDRTIVQSAAISTQPLCVEAGARLRG